jgi:hypothetical protein
VPGFTAERPRDMTLMYREVDGAAKGYIVLESLYDQPDRHYAREHDFEPVELDDGRLGTVVRPAREIAALGLPGVRVGAQDIAGSPAGFVRKLELGLPGGMRFVELTLEANAVLQKAWVNGVLALDTSIVSKHKARRPGLRLYYPPDGALDIELLTESGEALGASVVTWHDLPGLLTAPFMGNWPDDARPVQYGPRAEKVQHLELKAADQP